MAAITTTRLNKIYSGTYFNKQSVHALKDFSFTVNEGEIFGLLGPNGAGKTTLIKILLGITLPTEGDASVLNKSINDVSYKKETGYLPENHKFPLYMTGEQVLEYYGQLSGLDNNVIKSNGDKYLNLVQMEKWKKTKIKKYSKGMMQRLGLAQAMLNEPRLIFLDEPTDGVDPLGRKEIRDILMHLKQEGKTIFLNSHLLSEVEQVCDRVAILNKGSLIREGTVKEITNVSSAYKFMTSELGNNTANELMNKYKVTLHGHHEFLLNTNDIESLNKVIDYLRSKQVLIHSVSQERSSLESMFIDLVSTGGQN